MWWVQEGGGEMEAPAVWGQGGKQGRDEPVSLLWV